MIKELTVEQAQVLADVIKSNDGRIFTAKFIKRTTGEERVMVARLGVRKHLKGGELPFCPYEKKVLPVYDMQKKDYRMINLEGLISISMGGETVCC